MKNCLALILSVFFVFSFMISVNSADTLSTVSVQNTSAQPGEQINVEVSIKNNPGLATLLLRVNYDPSVLTLIDAKDGSVFGNGNAYFGRDFTKCPYMLIWEDGLTRENYTADGTLATLTFTVAENASPGETEISVDVDTASTLNVDLKHIQINTSNGVVNITSFSKENVPVVTPSTTKSETQIEVPFTIKKDYDHDTVQLFVSYDESVLTLVGTNKGEIIQNGEQKSLDGEKYTPYTLILDNDSSTKDDKAEEVQATLYFSAKKDAPDGEYDVKMQMDDQSTSNPDSQNAKITIKNGSVQVSGDKSNTKNIILICTLCLVAVCAVIITIVFIKKTKKKEVEA